MSARIRSQRGRTWRRRPGHILHGLIAWLLFFTTTACHANSIEEHEIKALFLFNFANFVSWPQEAIQDEASPIVYCVTGQNPLTQALEELLKGEIIKGHPLKFQLLTNQASADDCHVLFIHTEQLEEHRALLSQLTGRPVLTVSDRRGFTESLGMVALLRENSRIRPAINLHAVERAGLKISSKLLRLSIIKP